MQLSTLLLSLLAIITLVVSAPIDITRTHEKRYTGRGTWFNAGLGSCGKHNSNSQPIIAVNHGQYKRAMCGKWVTITNTKNKRIARGYVEDMCPGCPWGALDMSKGLFKLLEPNLGVGVLAISWGTPTSKRSLNETVADTVDASVVDDGTVDDGAEASDDGYNFDPADELTAEELDAMMNSPEEEV